MRGLKFRAWDTKENRYTDAEIFISNHSKIYRIFWQELEPAYDSEIIVELSTGLKDKNGKEIHIGDIVSEHQGDIVGEIVQNPSGEYRIAWVGIFGGESVLYDHLPLCEVIDNIHENPELIGKGGRMKPLCSNCLSILNIYGSCDKCNKLLLKEIEERRKNEPREYEAHNFRSN